MTLPAKRRTHLVERAYQAMGGSTPVALTPDEAPTSGTDTALAEAPSRPESPRPGPVATATAALEEAATPVPSGATAEVARPGSGAKPASAPAASARQTVTPPSLERMRQAGLVNAPDGAIRMRLAEEFSVIHHQILRTIRTMEPPAEGSGRARRVVLVTSARPGEGKTFCSLNIAASIAQGRSAPVLLVDADGKYGSLSALLGLDNAPGLRALASDPAQLPAPLLVQTELRNLSVLPYGTPVPGMPGVPPGTTVAAAIQRLAALLPQHIILLDTPPCLSTSDPSSLAPIAGQVVLVVEAEKTQRSEVEAALDMVEACPNLQLMLNQTRMNTSETFGSYGAYGGYGVYGQKPEASA